jgi:hypothetical protein
MTTKDFDNLGAECFNRLREINPKGGMKEFIRMAVEFGYKRAVKNLTIQNVTTRFSFINFMLGFMVGGIFCLAILYFML